MPFAKLTAAEIAGRFREATPAERDVLSLKYGGTLYDWEAMPPGWTCTVLELSPIEGEGLPE